MLTLEEAKNWLRSRLSDGAACPCCQQFAKIYRRQIHSGMAYGLVILYQLDPTGKSFWHLKDITKTGNAYSIAGDFAKLEYWGLIEEQELLSEGEKKSSGSWRLTELGIRFVRREAKVNKYTRIYNGKALKNSDNQPQVTIDQCLGKKFSYYELMGWEKSA